VAKIIEALTSAGQTAEDLAQKTGLGPGRIRRLLKRSEAHVIREGGGVKGDPFQFRLPDSIHSAGSP
jgi:hypothetical protein